MDTFLFLSDLYSRCSLALLFLATETGGSDDEEDEDDDDADDDKPRSHIPCVVFISFFTEHVVVLVEKHAVKVLHSGPPS